ncbi:hypothetical protein N7519_001492 [Penicillium mononematosum]|uniref:uncharacterized protein n=1 Tax=Penicillium mononematosum TaxID=268346 RepID=UPI002548D40F|nr:uncharacterized protein N7519_001492 [Penicillium mononematosum]KAJ6191471.1 hypothetical protein N7519_001492 [Penicillium mononematosum]
MAESLDTHPQAEKVRGHSLHRLVLEDSIGHLRRFDVQSSTHSMTMADFMDMLEDMFHSLNTKVACYANNRETVDEARVVADFVRLKSCEDEPADQEPCPTEDETISLPIHFNIA